MNFQILEGSVAMQLRWGRNLYHRYIDNFLGNPPPIEF